MISSFISELLERRLRDIYIGFHYIVRNIEIQETSQVEVEYYHIINSRKKIKDSILSF
jgi:hypothetical protein